MPDSLRNIALPGLIIIIVILLLFLGKDKIMGTSKTEKSSKEPDKQEKADEETPEETD